MPFPASRDACARCRNSTTRFLGFEVGVLRCSVCWCVVSFKEKVGGECPVYASEEAYAADNPKGEAMVDEDPNVPEDAPGDIDPNQVLTEYCTVGDLTGTIHTEYQHENRLLTDEQVEKLGKVAELLEFCQEVLGPLDKHSGYRCPSLNKAVGGSPTSQHMKTEAADFSPKGPDTEDGVGSAFNKMTEALKEGHVNFGQFILESDGRGREGRKVWLHISLGAPYRDQSRCGEILRMKDGVYTLVGKVNFA